MALTGDRILASFGRGEGVLGLGHGARRYRWFVGQALVVRRSIDDYPFTESDLPADADELDLQRISWGVAISDDYEDAEPRVVLTVEEVGNPGAGLIAHLSPTIARRLRLALHDALVEIGEDVGR